MKFLAILLLVLPTLCNSQSVTGKWTTIDDNSGEEKSVVEIVERGGRVFGRITKIFVKPGEIQIQYAISARRMTAVTIRKSSEWRSFKTW
jgi:hypothetical protein